MRQELDPWFYLDEAHNNISKATANLVLQKCLLQLWGEEW